MSVLSSIATLLVFSALLSVCLATTYTVSTTGSNSNPGTSAAPFATLNHAVSVAAPNDSIEVTAGQYNLSSAVVIDKNLTITGNDSSFLATGQSNLMVILSSFVVLNSLSFTGSQSLTDSCIVVKGSQVSISNSQISFCTQAWNGGAIFVTADSSIIIAGTDFSYNGAYNGGAVYSQGSVVLNDVVFTNNSADFGGAIYSAGSFSATLSNFFSNAAIDGGAVFIDTSNSTASFRAAYFLGNIASNEGGAIYSEEALSIIFSTFLSNSAALGGGAIFTSQATSISSVVFITNSVSYDGGAIYVSGGDSVVRNSTFTQNSAAKGYGGAGYIAEGSLTFKYTIFNDNVAQNSSVNVVYNAVTESSNISCTGCTGNNVPGSPTTASTGASLTTCIPRGYPSDSSPSSSRCSSMHWRPAAADSGFDSPATLAPTGHRDKTDSSPEGLV